MAFSVSEQDILRIPADAAVLPVEISLSVSDGLACRRLAEVGGEALRQALREKRFLPIGNSAELDPCGLLFRHLLITAVPRWLTGKANELLMLHRCYESSFDLAEQLGCRRVAMPFLSAMGYRFPQEDAVHIARQAARRRELEVVFAADSEALLRLGREAYRKPEIVSYIGYYRDHAIFALDNGLFARVDLRRELREVSVIPYFEASYREGNNPLQPPLPPEEIRRLRRIYDEVDW